MLLYIKCQSPAGPPIAISEDKDWELEMTAEAGMQIEKTDRLGDPQHAAHSHVKIFGLR
jgi:hypothetical protein